MANIGHRAKTRPSPVFVNKVLLEHSYTPPFTPVSGWFLDTYVAVTTETTWSFTERFAAPWCKCRGFKQGEMRESKGMAGGGCFPLTGVGMRL